MPLSFWQRGDDEQRPAETADSSQGRQSEDGSGEGEGKGGTLTLREAADQAGVSSSTLKRWAQSDVIPEHDGGSEWTPAAVAHARIVARLRERGHSLAQIRIASSEGRLAYGYLEEIFPPAGETYSLDQAVERAGIERALIERVWSSIGFPLPELEELTEEDLQALRYIGSVLEAGFPLVAFLQIARVYGQSLSRIAEAETRLFHLYVHEPLMRDGVPGLQMAEEMENLARDLLPLTAPIMEYIHRRSLQHFVESDMVGHMESELDAEADLGRMRITVAFADLAGYTRFTEEEGEEQALSYVEHLIDAVTHTLPDDASLVKTIGDEAMVVGRDAAAMTDWAVGFQYLFEERPSPRIGIHHGLAIYRDGDYFGRDINLAARVVARARGGEVLVTDSVLEAVESRSPHLAFERIGEVKLKGFDQPHGLARVSQAA